MHVCVCVDTLDGLQHSSPETTATSGPPPFFPFLSSFTFLNCFFSFPSLVSFFKLSFYSPLLIPSPFIFISVLRSVLLLSSPKLLFHLTLLFYPISSPSFPSIPGVSSQHLLFDLDHGVARGAPHRPPFQKIASHSSATGGRPPSTPPRPQPFTLSKSNICSVHGASDVPEVYPPPSAAALLCIHLHPHNRSASSTPRRFFHSRFDLFFFPSHPLFFH